LIQVNVQFLLCALNLRCLDWQIGNKWTRAIMTAEQSLNDIASKIRRAQSLRSGVISFHLLGKEGGDFYIECTREDVHVLKGAPPTKRHFELIGDAGRIASVLNGTKDARAQFLGGGFRIRGDLRYASELALELGLLKEPI
jgi:hypothetical protein